LQPDAALPEERLRAVPELDLSADGAAKPVHDRTLHGSAAMSDPVRTASLPDGWGVSLDRVSIGDLSARRRTCRQADGRGSRIGGRAWADHLAWMRAVYAAAAMPSDTSAAVSSDLAAAVSADSAAGVPFSDLAAAVSADICAAAMSAYGPTAVSALTAAAVSSVTAAMPPDARAAVSWDDRAAMLPDPTSPVPDSGMHHRTPDVPSLPPDELPVGLLATAIRRAMSGQRQI
jgi:hypothetical protein